MLEAGLTEVLPFNPYWQQRGRTFEDHDHSRVVLEQAEWSDGQHVYASAAHPAASVVPLRQRSSPSNEKNFKRLRFIPASYVNVIQARSV